MSPQISELLRDQEQKGRNAQKKVDLLKKYGLSINLAACSYHRQQLLT